MAEGPVEVFFSYAHEDEALVDKLRTHLALLKRQGVIGDWHDRQIVAGTEWQGEIDAHLESAGIILLCVSADFLASDYCWGVELRRAMQRHAEGAARVIPVLLRDCDWQGAPFGRLQGLPKDMRPVTSWTNRDEAFADVARGIRKAVREITSATKGVRSHDPAAVQPEPPPQRSSGPPAPPASGRAFRDVEEPWCPEMVVIPAGSFLMGSPDDERDRRPVEAPQHKVRFARPYAFGRYTVTRGEFAAFVADTGHLMTGGIHRRDGPDWALDPKADWCSPGFVQTDRHPAVGVSWDDAVAYCAWLAERSGQLYRLPSEAEWEYACRAGTTTPFWTGATISTDLANYDGTHTYGSGKKGVYRKATVAVDDPGFPANRFGLWHMHGNVWEWCQDVWHGDYAGAPNDGAAWTDGDLMRRVVRGGSWYNYPRYLRSANRISYAPEFRNDYTGLRVVRTLTS